MLADPTHGESAGEAELVEACRNGERSALERVFRREAAGLTRLLSRMVRDRYQVEDLLQSTFAEAIVAFPRFRGDATVRTWMSRIAVNLVRQSWRRGAVRRRAQLQLVAAEVAPGAGPDVLSEARRRLGRVYHHLTRIGIKKRLAFALHVIDGRSIDEVAALTGASRAATRSRVFWARRALRAAAVKDPLLRDWLVALEATR